MVNAKDVKMGAAYVSVSAETKDAEEKIKIFKRHFTALEGVALKVSGALTAAIGSFTGATLYSVKKFANIGDTLAKTSKRIGISVKSLSSLGYAAEISGSSLASFEKGIKRMDRAIIDARDGLKETQRAFGHIGVRIEDLKGMNPGEQFKYIAAGLRNLTDETEKSALAQKIFGRAGSELVPMINKSSEALAKLQNRYFEIFRTIDAKKAEKLTDAFTRFKFALSGVVSNFGSKFAGIVKIILTLLEKALSAANYLIDRIPMFAALTTTLVSLISASGTVLALHTVLNTDAIMAKVLEKTGGKKSAGLYMYEQTIKSIKQFSVYAKESVLSFVRSSFRLLKKGLAPISNFFAASTQYIRNLILMRFPRVLGWGGKIKAFFSPALFAYLIPIIATALAAESIRESVTGKEGLGVNNRIKKIWDWVGNRVLFFGYTIKDTTELISLELQDKILALSRAFHSLFSSIMKLTKFIAMYTMNPLPFHLWKKAIPIAHNVMNSGKFKFGINFLKGMFAPGISRGLGNDSPTYNALFSGTQTSKRLKEVNSEITKVLQRPYDLIHPFTKKPGSPYNTDTKKTTLFTSGFFGGLGGRWNENLGAKNVDISLKQLDTLKSIDRKITSHGGFGVYA